jgi:hypothetical protein
MYDEKGPSGGAESSRRRGIHLTICTIDRIAVPAYMIIDNIGTAAFVSYVIYWCIYIGQLPGDFKLPN